MDSIYLLSVVGASVFFLCFFPISTPNSDVDNTPPNSIGSVFLNSTDLYDTNVTKLLFIVIDALRLDFVNPNYMPLTSKLIQQNGCLNKIKVETPTVTLPRIKALTAGNIPQFIDMVLNLASTEILSDSIIHSAAAMGRKVVFYGDDTWLRLFPDKFYRYEGVNSFFVRDFTIVDDNVTRNINVEFHKDDWDIMILHYLGLDHIGHVYGPFSPLVSNKLAEMDEIIFNSYNNLTKYGQSVIMITGDHGMRDSGGHGGSTYSETNVPLLIIGSQCGNNSFRQTDIPVNLAVLLGLKIPALSIGRVHKSMLLQLSKDKYLYALHYNSFLLNQKHSCCSSLYNEANLFYVDYLQNLNEDSGAKARELYENCLETISEHLSNVSVEQNFEHLLLYSIILLNCLIILLCDLISKKVTASVTRIYFFLIIIIEYLNHDKLIIYVTLVTTVIISLRNIYELLTFVKVPDLTSNLLFFTIFSILHPITFLSSSYVEEEHQFWYFVNILFTFFQLLQFSKSKNTLNLLFCIIILVLFRFLRSMNSTGDKWANYPDMSDWFLQDANFIWYQFLFILGLLLILVTQIVVIEQKHILIYLLNIVILILIYIFKQDESSVFLGKIIWFLIMVHFCLLFGSSQIPTWVLIITLLLKPFNLLMIPYCIFSSHNFTRYYKKTELIVLLNFFLSNMLYFAQGHSNSLASVDISIGYIGLSSYQPVLVIGQVLCHTQAFPVLCLLLIFSNKHIDKNRVWTTLFCLRLYIYLMTAAVNFIFRHHIFIWSVFAPKLFIEFTHLLFLFLEYLIYNIVQLVPSYKRIYKLLKMKNLCINSKVKS